MVTILQSALLFLINTLFDLYLFVLVVRVVLVYVGAHYFDPITQFVTKLTDVIVRPLRRYLPNFRRIECASIVLIVVLEMIKFLFLSLISFGIPNLFGIAILAVMDAFKILLVTFFYAILLQAILSWFQPASPIHHTLLQFTSPIMRPLQRLIPPIGGIDISPIPALILLQLIIIMIINPLIAVGLGVAFG